MPTKTELETQRDEALKLAEQTTRDMGEEIARLNGELVRITRDRDWRLGQLHRALAEKKASRVEMGQANHRAAVLTKQIATSRTENDRALETQRESRVALEVELAASRARVAELEGAIRRHRKDLWGDGEPEYVDDAKLYDVLGKGE